MRWSWRTNPFSRAGGVVFGRNVARSTIQLFLRGLKAVVQGITG
jgi:hypothetical protein